MKHINTIIVGQGLAGSLLAWHLLKREQTVLIIDNDHVGSASITAAGIINPVTGQRLVLHPSTNQHQQIALKCYSELEQFFRQTFYHALPMLRVFSKPADVLQYNKRTQDNNYVDFIGELYIPSEYSHIKQHQKTGGFLQLKTGYLDISLLLQTLKLYFREKECYINEKIEYSNIIPTSQSIKYQAYECDRLIFCEGYQIQHNPWFSSLPLVPTKGEILTFTSNDLGSKHIINNGKWLLPTKDGKFRFGATYQPNVTDTHSSDDNRETLQKQLSTMIHSDFQIYSQQAGVRPCTIDRDPLIGSHPHEPRLGVFNGFGSKGALTIPSFSQQLSEYITGKNALPIEGNISRLKYCRNNHVFS